LQKIAAITDRKTLSRLLGGQLRADVDALNKQELLHHNLLGLWVAQDLDNPARYVPFLMQGGLGMPDRGYYLDNSPDTAAIRAKYTPHLARVLCSRTSRMRTRRRRVSSRSKSAWQPSMPRASSRSTSGRRTTTGRARISIPRHADSTGRSISPPRASGHRPISSCGIPVRLRGWSALVASEPLETWKEYLALRAIEHAGAYLPKPFVDEGFEFYGKTLNGTRSSAIAGNAASRSPTLRSVMPSANCMRRVISRRPRRRAPRPWCTTSSPRSRAASINLELDGARDEGQGEGQACVLRIGVGYPDHWIDYSALDIRFRRCVRQRDARELFETRRNLASRQRSIGRNGS